MATINVRDENAGNDAAPFEIYYPDFDGGNKIGDTYSAAQLREGISLTVPDDTNSIEVVSRGLRCGSNQLITFTIPRVPDANFNMPVANPDTYVVITGPTQRPLGESATLEAQVTNAEDPNGPFTYSWSTGATTRTITVTETSAVTRNYTCTVTSPNGTNGSDSHSVEWADIDLSLIDLENDGPIFQNQNDSSLSAFSTNPTGGRFGISWRDSTSSEQIRGTITDSSPSSGYDAFEIEIVEIPSINTNQYEYRIIGNPPPGTYNLAIRFTVSADVGDPDTETITQVILITSTNEEQGQSTLCRGSYTRYISAARTSPNDFCSQEGGWNVTQTVSLDSNDLVPLHSNICYNNQPFNGNDNWYIFLTDSTNGVNPHQQVALQISPAGNVIDSAQIRCNDSSGNTGAGGLKEKDFGDAIQ